MEAKAVDRFFFFKIGFVGLLCNCGVLKIPSAALISPLFLALFSLGGLPFGCFQLILYQLADSGLTYLNHISNSELPPKF